MKWITALIIGAILAFTLPMALGGSDGVWMTGWTKVGTYPTDRRLARSPVLGSRLPRIGARLPSILQLAQQLIADRR